MLPAVPMVPVRLIAVAKSLGLYRQCSGGKPFGTVEPGGAGALPIRRFVLNPLWGFNCQMTYQKELNNHGRGGAAGERHRPSFYSRASGLVQIPMAPVIGQRRKPIC